MYVRGDRRMYRHAGTGLLRAARVPAAATPGTWPDLADDAAAEAWRAWLRAIWSSEETAEGITLASPALARRAGEICSGASCTVKDLRRVVASVARYVLRETARPTPFGLFAGVTAVGFGDAAKVRWGRDHRPVARADAEWLADVITGLEASPDLLERLLVTVSNLRSVRGGRVVVPAGSAQVEIRYTPAVRAVERAAGHPIRFGALAGILAGEFPEAPSRMIRGMLAELVRQKFLVTSLRPPGTVTGPLGYVISQLQKAGAGEVPEVAAAMRELRAIRAGLERHNHAAPGDRRQARESVARRMRGLSRAGKTPLAVDLQLDCDLQLPRQVGREMEAAASALLRLSARPGGSRTWRDYRAAFLDRYGTGTLVPVTELVNPETGLGFPAGYPGSLLDPPAQPQATGRDDQLLALVHQAALDGRDEIALDDNTITSLAGEPRAAPIPSHVELSARIHARSLEALERGEFTLTVCPARAAGTMTGRFTPSAGAGLGEVFANLPAIDAGAIPAQLSFPPAYPHAENISRTPRFLPHIIPLGEHRGPGDDGVIELDDLAVTADWHRMYLVSLRLRRPVEPQVFNALRLDKQPPALARFLANLPRGSAAAWTEFDWGAAASLPHLPRVRYRRAVLSPARWQISSAGLPPRRAGWPQWSSAVEQWRRRWRLPEVAELRDGDRMLRLDLAEPAHAAILRAHLDRSGLAVLTEAADEAGYGWLDGHAHEVAVPLVTAKPAAPSPPADRWSLVRVPGNGHGQLPGAPDAEWLFAKVYIHPRRQSEVIAAHLPRLLESLGGDRQWWFLRYRDPHDPHHLRLRIRVTGPGDYGCCAAGIGAWAARLRRDGIAWRLAFDTYYPETGRYGSGTAMKGAEAVFAADSAVAAAQLAHVLADAVDLRAVTAANFAAIAAGFTGSLEAGMTWLAHRPRDRQASPAPRVVSGQAVALATGEADPPGWEAVASAWEARRAALAAYRTRLPAGISPDAVLESLLHVHHIRAAGLDRDSERVCHRLARSAALTWQARNGRERR